MDQYPAYQQQQAPHQAGEQQSNSYQAPGKEQPQQELDYQPYEAGQLYQQAAQQTYQQAVQQPYQQAVQEPYQQASPGSRSPIARGPGPIPQLLAPVHTQYSPSAVQQPPAASPGPRTPLATSFSSEQEHQQQYGSGPQQYQGAQQQPQQQYGSGPQQYQEGQQQPQQQYGSGPQQYQGGPQQPQQQYGSGPQQYQGGQQQPQQQYGSGPQQYQGGQQQPQQQYGSGPQQYQGGHNAGNGYSAQPGSPTRTDAASALPNQPTNQPSQPTDQLANQPGSSLPLHGRRSGPATPQGQYSPGQQYKPEQPYPPGQRYEPGQQYSPGQHNQGGHAYSPQQQYQGSTGSSPQGQQYQPGQQYQGSTSAPPPLLTTPGARHAIGWQRNVDVLGVQQSGITGAHTRKDGVNAFEGYYGKAHAGKSQQSSLGSAEPDRAGVECYLTELPHKRQFAGAGSTSIKPQEQGGLAPHGPLERQQSSGARQHFHGTAVTRDHLSHGNSGICAPVEAAKGRARGEYVQAHIQSQIIMTPQGLSGVGQAPPPPPSAYAGFTNRSHLVQREAGLMQHGQTVLQPAGKFSGLTNYSQLQNGEHGLHGKPTGQGFQPIPHAGKITASNIVLGGGGITVMPRERLMGHSAAGGEGPGGGAQGSAPAADTYKVLQVGQLQMKQNVERNWPDRF